MATIGSLALETLFGILAFAGESGPFRAERQVALGTLAAASLVSRKWRERAQAQMWKQLFLTRAGEMQRVTASPLWGKFRTQSVNISMKFLKGRTLEGVMSELVELEKIELSGASSEPLDAAWLNFPFRSGLTSLGVGSMTLSDIPLVDLCPLFDLRYLSAEHRFPPAIRRTLLASSSSSLHLERYELMTTPTRN